MYIYIICSPDARQENTFSSFGYYAFYYYILFEAVETMNLASLSHSSLQTSVVLWNQSKPIMLKYMLIFTYTPFYSICLPENHQLL